MGLIFGFAVGVVTGPLFRSKVWPAIKSALDNFKS